MTDLKGLGLRGLAGLCALAMLSTGVGAQTPPASPAPDRAAVESIVHDYLLAHPEIIPEALTALKTRQTTKLLNENRAAIETPFGHEWEGDPHGDVTLVEFFDYNCGFCRASVPDIDRLLREDPHLKVVYREIPVLGADSDAAALVSLSLAQTKGGNWAAFHRAVYAHDEASAQNVAKAAQASGFQTPSAKALADPALRAQINANLSLAQKIGVDGTPGWVVGNQLIDGALGYERLKQAIAEARAARTVNP
ncbi:MAG: DsbA family protein [Alphaproteobacteria bacterium]|nr:DsbA family protein [Alphaproteobacteria bacterium]MDE2340978.1 thioredoxin domain-containing protein [Alphaproteobacteria bacterium]